MSGKVVGYKRVSSVIQNTERQLEGIAVDKIFEDKLTGKDTNRPQFNPLVLLVEMNGIEKSMRQSL